MEQWIPSLQSLNPAVLLVCMAALLFAKNLLPPLPSDALTVFSGTLIALGVVDAVTMLAACTFGSTAGFMVMFGIGNQMGSQMRNRTGNRSEVFLQEREHLWFVPVRYWQGMERLFQRYGYWVIIANRFLGVKRVTVAFFAGMSGLSVWKTCVCACCSAFAWSAVLLGAGYYLGGAWREAMRYLSVYAWVMFGVVIAIGVIAVLRYHYLQRLEQRS
jgi:membrane protein DedA with SNARE-associated domain